MLRFYARVVESYTQHINFDRQDCIRLTFAKWVQRIKRVFAQHLCAYPLHDQYPFDPSLLKWKDRLQQRTDRSMPREDADCISQEMLYEMFMKVPRPPFIRF